MWHRVDYDCEVESERHCENEMQQAEAERQNRAKNDVADGKESAARCNVGSLNTLSIGASVFHFYPRMFAFNFPLFSGLIIPNLVWEMLGFNAE